MDPLTRITAGISYEYRYVLRDLASRGIKDMQRGLWGYGMESFSYLVTGELYGQPYRFVSCDSAWLELMVETGYVGLLMVSFILFLPLYAWKGLKYGPDRLNCTLERHDQLLLHDVKRCHVRLGPDRVHSVDGDCRGNGL